MVVGCGGGVGRSAEQDLSVVQGLKPPYTLIYWGGEQKDRKPRSAP